MAALVALCRFLDEEPAFAAAGLVEALSAGAGAIGVRDQVIGAIAGSLSDAYRRSKLIANPVLTGELVAGAAMTLCARAVADGRVGKLYALAPTLAYLALVPAAGRTQRPRRSAPTTTRAERYRGRRSSSIPACRPRRRSASSAMSGP